MVSLDVLSLTKTTSVCLLLLLAVLPPSSAQPNGALCLPPETAESLGFASVRLMVGAQRPACQQSYFWKSLWLTK